MRLQCLQATIENAGFLGYKLRKFIGLHGGEFVGTEGNSDLMQAQSDDLASAAPARKPWKAPAMIVSTLADDTAAGSASAPDGSVAS